MAYTITSVIRAKARRLGVSVKPSKVKGKKLDVFKGDKKVASIGALGMGDYAGWIKLVTEEKFGEILGATIVGPEVTELLPELTLARMLELTPAEIARNVHAHPTLSEILMEVAHLAEGKAIHI